MMLVLGPPDATVWHLRVVTQSIRSLLAYARFAPQSKNWHFARSTILLGVQKRTRKSEKFFYPKNGGICISTNAYHSVWKSSKNVSVFVPKWGQNAVVPLFCVLDTVSTPSLPRKNFKGDKVMIRFFMPIYSPINSEIGLNLKRATLQGIKP